MFKDFRLVDLDLEMVLVILFLGVSLLFSLDEQNRNIASAIVGGLTGYLTRTARDVKKGGDDD